MEKDKGCHEDEIREIFINVDKKSNEGKSTGDDVKLSLADKIFNFVTIIIPHLESIILDRSDPQSKYRVINQILKDNLGVLKKKLQVINSIIERYDEGKEIKRKECDKWADVLNIKPSTIENKLVNRGEIEKSLDFMEKGMFLPAFKKWRSIVSTTSLAKRMMVFNRKLDLIFTTFRYCIEMDPNDIFCQPPDGEVWSKINKITTYIKVYSEEKIKEDWNSQNEFLYVVQAALAKTTNSLVNPKYMTQEDIGEIMKVNFFEYENWCNKRKVEGFKSVWKKNFIPKLSSKFWQNIFKYMLKKDSVIEDVEMFIAFPNKDCIRDYWNMAETYASKVSRRLMYGPIAFRKRLFLKPNILSDYLRNTTSNPHNVCHLIDTKWKFLGKYRNARLTPEEMFPTDIYFDNENEHTISVNFMCSMEFPFFEIVENYTKNFGIELLKKKPLLPSPELKKVEETKKKVKKQQESKMGWMFNKMIGVLDIFKGGSGSKGAKEKESKEKVSEESSSMEDSEEEQTKAYRNFGGDDDDSSESGNVSPPIPKVTTKKSSSKQPQASPASELDSQKAQKSSQQSAQNEEFNEKFEQSIMEIESHMHHMEDNINPEDDVIEGHMPDVVLKKGQSMRNLNGPPITIQRSSKPIESPSASQNKLPHPASTTASSSKSVKSSNLELKLQRTGTIDEKNKPSSNSKSKLADQITQLQQNIETEAVPDVCNPPIPKLPATGGKDYKEMFKKIIIHIHGGGFMAMSSTYHETYLRLFANEIERPVFSIDYRLAPIVQFPEPLHDCIKGYFWVKQFVEDVIGTTLESVILIGDSAGGNLAIALNFWLIENNVRPPDMLIGCYSALRLDMKSYSPSFFKTMDDYFLSYAGLWACCKQYLPDSMEGTTDKFACPIFANEELLKKMPKTRLFICMDDPLSDDQFRLGHSLLKAGVDIKITAFHHFIHGMLSLNRNEVLPVEVFQDEVMKAMRAHFNDSSKDSPMLSARNAPQTPPSQTQLPVPKSAEKPSNPIQSPQVEITVTEPPAPSQIQTATIEKSTEGQIAESPAEPVNQKPTEETVKKPAEEIVHKPTEPIAVFEETSKPSEEEPAEKESK